MRKNKNKREEELELKHFSAFFLSNKADIKVGEFTLSSKRLLAVFKDYYSEIYPDYLETAQLSRAVKRWQELYCKKFVVSVTEEEARAKLLEVLALAARNALENAYTLLFNPMFRAILTTAQIRAEKEMQEYLGIPLPNLGAKEIRKEIDTWPNVAPFLAVRHGGDQRPPETFRWDGEKRKQLAQTVADLPQCNGEPLWKYIINFFEHEKYGSHCIVMLSARDELVDVPPVLLREAFTRRLYYWQRNTASFLLVPETCQAAHKRTIQFTLLTSHQATRRDARLCALTPLAPMLLPFKKTYAPLRSTRFRRVASSINFKLPYQN